MIKSNPWFPVNIWNQPNDPNIYICIYSIFHGELPLFIVKSTSHHGFPPGSGLRTWLQEDQRVTLSTYLAADGNLLGEISTWYPPVSLNRLQCKSPVKLETMFMNFPMIEYIFIPFTLWLFNIAMV